MLRPAKRITDRGGFVRTGRGDERISNLLKQSGRNPANLLHHFWRVASEVTAQGLENAARMLQGQIPLGKTQVGMAFVEPGLFVVATLLFVPPGEKTGCAFI